MVQPIMRGVLGMGLTLLVIGAGMASVNGLARGWAARKLHDDPGNVNARAVLALF